MIYNKNILLIKTNYMETIENPNEVPRLTAEEFSTIANTPNPTEDPEVIAFMEKNGFTFEPGARAKVKVDGDDIYFVTDPKDFGTVLEAHTIEEEGLE